MSVAVALRAAVASARSRACDPAAASASGNVARCGRILAAGERTRRQGAQALEATRTERITEARRQVAAFVSGLDITIALFREHLRSRLRVSRTGHRHHGGRRGHRVLG